MPLRIPEAALISHPVHYVPSSAQDHRPQNSNSTESARFGFFQLTSPNIVFKLYKVLLKHGLLKCLVDSCLLQHNSCDPCHNQHSICPMHALSYHTKGKKNTVCAPQMCHHPRVTGLRQLTNYVACMLFPCSPAML